MINSSLVKELRHMTSAPLMECKKALEETNGNLEEAKNFLRKKGQLLASKKWLVFSRELQNPFRRSFTIPAFFIASSK